MALGTFTLTGTWTRADGLTATGSIVITPTFPVIDAANDLIVAKVPNEVTLEAGAISVALPVISEVDEGYTYHVKEMVEGQQVSPGVYTRSYTIAVPADAAGSTLDITTLIIDATDYLPAPQRVVSVDGQSGEVDLSDSYVEVGTGFVGTIPCYAAGVSGTANTLQPVAASWWCLDPDHWPTPPAGKTLQYRLVATFEGFSTGDVASADMFDTVAGAPIIATDTKAKVAGSQPVQVTSAWQDFPATIKGGYVRGRNVTAARGTNVNGFIELRIA